MSHLRLQFQDAQGRTGSIILQYIFQIHIRTNLCPMYPIFHLLRMETLRLTYSRPLDRKIAHISILFGLSFFGRTKQNAF
jgi:hypothetical protein